MALVSCSNCHRSSLSNVGTCDYCGKTIKFNIWTRKLRRKEAYGFLLLFTGCLLLSAIRIVGLSMILSGVIMICFSLFTPRSRNLKNNVMLSKDELRFLI
jgi:hypothetical protein